MAERPTAISNETEPESVVELQVSADTIARRRWVVITAVVGISTVITLLNVLSSNVSANIGGLSINHQHSLPPQTLASGRAFTNTFIRTNRFEASLLAGIAIGNGGLESAGVALSVDGKVSPECVVGTDLALSTDSMDNGYRVELKGMRNDWLIGHYQGGSDMLGLPHDNPGCREYLAQSNSGE